ncbi:DUF397 domain-containing protein [Nocardia sp. NPDC004068]|uniref:DUF397 domain-containing protein n=1 Tax=Nocardia sp. NPDC004068 TaxID=3364303 RepID=UPI0036C313C7
MKAVRNRNVTRCRPLDGYVKSSASDGGGQCVLIRRKPNEKSVYIRDSKYLRVPGNPPEDEPIIEMPATAWDSLQAVVLGRGSDRLVGQPEIEQSDNGVILRGVDGTTLAFTSEEWTAFKMGLLAGEFEPSAMAA